MKKFLTIALAIALLTISIHPAKGNNSAIIQGLKECLPDDPSLRFEYLGQVKSDAQAINRYVLVSAETENGLYFATTPILMTEGHCLNPYLQNHADDDLSKLPDDVAAQFKPLMAEKHAIAAERERKSLEDYAKATGRSIDSFQLEDGSYGFDAVPPKPF